MSSVGNDVSPNNTLTASYLCYVNGRRVPVIGVVIRNAVNEIPTAEVTFFPSQTLLRLGAEDRVSVTVFYLDHHYDTPNGPTYRLIFDGEIVGWAYTSAGDTRSLVVTAAADIAIFQQMEYSFLNTEDAIGRNAASAAAAATTVSRTGVLFPYSLFVDGLIYTDTKGEGGNDPPTPTVRRPFDILYNAVRGISDINIPKNERTRPVINFFARWCRLRQFNQRFAAYPDFDDASAGDPTEQTIDAQGVFPIINAARATHVLSELQKVATEWATDGAIYVLLNGLFQSVYYEMAMLMTPPAVRVRLEDGVILDRKTKEATPKTPLRLASYYVKPQMLYSVPPMCNVLFPSMVRNLQYAENYREQPTRVYMLDGYLSSLQDPGLSADMISWAYPAEAHAAMRSRFPAQSSANVGSNAPAADPYTTGKNVLIWPEEFFKGPVSRRGVIPAIYAALIHQVEAAKNSKAVEAREERAITDQATSRLLSLFAEYEYFRQRYSQRGGAADLVFNPYVVPGYPTVIFDKPGGLDQVGYIHTVVHNLTNTGFSTLINYGSARTLNEWVALIESECKRLGRAVHSGPADPFDAVRWATQNINTATDHYEAFFWGREVLAGEAKKAVAFNVADVLKSKEGLVIEGPSEGEFPLRSRGAGEEGAVGTRPMHVHLPYAERLVPTEHYEEVFENTGKALKLVSRPICSLVDYAKFINENTTPDWLNKSPNKSVVGGAVVYERIIRLTVATAEDPLPTATGTATERDPAVSQTTDTATTVSATTAYRRGQVRADWDLLLDAYINEVKSLAPSE